MQKKVRMANLLFLPFLSVFPAPSHPFVHPFLPLSLLSLTYSFIFRLSMKKYLLCTYSDM